MNHSFATLVVVAVSSLVIVAGCEPSPDATLTSVSTSPATSAASPEKLQLEIVDGDGYQAAINKHQGHVVLVDFWATWCEPCTEKFPHVVELHRQHEKAGLRVVGFACNDLSEEAEVRQFLAEQGATFDNLMTKFGNSTKTNDTFDLHGVPQYKLYDRQGKLRYQFADIYDDLESGEPVENIDQRVVELLAEPS